MKRITKPIIAIAAIAFILTPAVALAQTTRNQDGQVNTMNRPDIAEIRERAKARAEEARTSAEERKAEILQRVEERKAQVKTDVCERRQLVLERIMPRLSQGATSVKSSIDTVYTRVAGFYESGQLTVENYDDLVSDIEVAKADAEAAIASIDDQSFTLDCENPSVGQQLDGFRMAVRDAKDSLKEYRKTVVALISSMRSAASTQNDNDTQEAGGTDTNQNDTEGTSNE